MTFLVKFGKWGGFHAHADSCSARLCIGFIAFCIIYPDFEDLLKNMKNKLEGLD